VKAHTQTVPKSGEPRNGSFTRIVHDRRGEPAEVLRLTETPLSELAVGPNDVLLRVLKVPIHPGDLHMIRGLSNGGPAGNIEASNPRVPGFEGIGVVLAIGEQVEASRGPRVGQRVVFFSGNAKAWATHVSVPASSVTKIPDSMSDGVAAQLLINSITARTLLRVGHDLLPQGFQPPVFILQTAAGSAVQTLVAEFAKKLDVRPIKLVRTRARAKTMRLAESETPVFATEDDAWKAGVLSTLGGHPLYIAIDAVGGSFVNEVASLLSDGGSIVNFGWLGEGAADLAGFAPRNLAFVGVSLGQWMRKNSAETQAADIQSFIEMAQTSPFLFEVAADYPLERFQEAILQVTKAGKAGTVLLSMTTS
jgi:NADPH:quinone reductase-like Zn-dependent oxidoreductase